MNIYIVEDEVITALEIKSTIQKLGYHFAGMSTNYTDALEGIKKTNPDLIILDITLKYSKSGIDVAKELKKTRNIPIIYLTSITDEKVMLQAIQTDPVSYLIKPFHREELHSAILLSIHKYASSVESSNTLLKLDNGFFYNEKEKLLYDSQHNPIILSPKERLILDLLIQAKGQIVSFQVIEEHIWRGESISNSARRTLIYRFHQKLGCKFIETVPTFGYRITIFTSQEDLFEKP